MSMRTSGRFDLKVMVLVPVGILVTALVIFAGGPRGALRIVMFELRRYTELLKAVAGEWL